MLDEMSGEEADARLLRSEALHDVGPHHPGRRGHVPREVDRYEVQRLLGQGAQLVDVMGQKDFEGSHIVGAVHIPLRKLAAEAPSRLDPSRAVIAARKTAAQTARNRTA